MQFRLTLLSAALLNAFAGTSQAQNADGAPAPVPRVEITGSNIKRIASETSLPVQTMRREDIERSGATTAAEVLSQLSGNSGNAYSEAGGSEGSSPGFAGASLRGLGEGSTLVLLNGRRLAVNGFNGQSVDINSIPAAAIQRIEVLKDGASAIYGTDAIGGVINFILRKDYEGKEITVTAGGTQHGGAGQKKVAGAVGFGNYHTDGYNVVASLDYARTERLVASQRGFSNNGYRPALGLDHTIGLASDPANGIVFGADGSPLFFNPALRQSGQCAPGMVRRESSPSICSYNPDGGIDLLPKSEKLNLVTRGTYALNAETMLYAEVLHSQTTSTYGTFRNVLNPLVDTVVVAPGDPRYPIADVLAAGGTADDAVLLAYVVPGSRRIDRARNRNQRVVIGVEGNALGWDYNSALVHSRSKSSDTALDGYYRTDAVIAAVQDPTFNVFGTPTAANLQALNGAAFRGRFREATSSTSSLDFKASRELFALPAGQVGFAFGGEIRREKLEDQFLGAAASGNLLNQGSFEGQRGGSRNVKAVFAELEVPLAKGLDAQFAGRVDHYSDFGTTTNPKAGLRWQPVQGFLARASVGTGFRAPSLTELHTPPVPIQTQGTDPVRCPVTHSPSDCDTQFSATMGGNSKLQPEESRQFSIGTVFEPAAGWLASADYWRIKKTDVIYQVGADLLLNPSSNAGLQQYIVRGPAGSDGLPGPIVNLIVAPQNFASLLTSGIDVELSYNRKTESLGKWGATLKGTWVHKYDLNIPGSGTSSPLGTAEFGSNPGAIQRWRHTAMLNWNMGPWGATLVHNYTGGYRDMALDGAGKVRHVGAWQTVDVQGVYSGWKNIKLSVGIRNLFDREPPSTNQTVSQPSGFDPRYTDPRGRYLYMNLNYAFK
jgi:iron complex outermembrane receptor protein